jgi:hypothetical protein
MSNSGQGSSVGAVHLRDMSNNYPPRPTANRRLETIRARVIVGGLIVGVLGTVPLWRSQARGISKQIEAERVQAPKIHRSCAEAKR